MIFSNKKTTAGICVIQNPNHIVEPKKIKYLHSECTPSLNYLSFNCTIEVLQDPIGMLAQFYLYIIGQ